MSKRTSLGGIQVDETEPLSIINIPIDWNATWKLAKQARSLRFLQDKDGNIIGFPVIQVDPTNPAKVLRAGSGSLFNNVTNLFEYQRTPTIFKTVAANAAGGTTLWTPAPGKSFRLMGGIITLTKDAACAAGESVGLYDGGTPIVLQYISSAALVATGNVIVIPYVFPGNGYLSAAANNALNLYLLGALTAGYAQASVWGTEE